MRWVRFWKAWIRKARGGAAALTPLFILACGAYLVLTYLPDRSEWSGPAAANLHRQLSGFGVALLTLALTAPAVAKRLFLQVHSYSGVSEDRAFIGVLYWSFMSASLVALAFNGIASLSADGLAEAIPRARYLTVGSVLQLFAFVLGLAYVRDVLDATPRSVNLMHRALERAIDEQDWDKAQLHAVGISKELRDLLHRETAAIFSACLNLHIERSKAVLCGAMAPTPRVQSAILASLRDVSNRLVDVASDDAGRSVEWVRRQVQCIQQCVTECQKHAEAEGNQTLAVNAKETGMSIEQAIAGLASAAQ